jgi:SAM-dependent methyltransferase
VSEQPTARSMWEERFGADACLYGTEPNEFLRARAVDLPASRVLCLAEGEGRNAVFLAGLGHDVHSVDLTDSGVAKTLRLAEARGVVVHARVGDLAVFDLGIAQWDVVVSIFAHMPTVVRRDLHARVVGALRPGGVLVLEAYTPDQIGRGTGGPSLPEMTMTLVELRDELSGLTFEHAAELTREVVEGPGHTGVGAVVQVVARRPG